MINTPYVNNGEGLKEHFVNEHPNRAARRAALISKRFRGNNGGISLVVNKMGKFKKTFQHVPILISFRNPSKNDPKRISYRVTGVKTICKYTN